jgi:hypothetical protein
MVQAPSPAIKARLENLNPKIGETRKYMTPVVILKKLDDMRENKRLLVIAASILALVLTALSTPPVPRGIRGVVLCTVVSIIFFFIVGLILCVGSGIVGGLMQSRKNLFKAYFWVEHPKSPKEVGIMQAAIDDRLRQLACDFHEVCSNEESFLANMRPTEPTELDLARKELVHLQSEVRGRKGMFWSAHHAALLFGFSVKASAKEYWNEPRRR